MASESNELLAGLLKNVSRSFYLTLRLLPGAVRRQVSLAYLLARTTDTIADTALVSADKRLLSLQKLRERILGHNRAPLDFGEFARCQASPSEKVLLEKCEDSLALLQTLSPADVTLVQTVLNTITSGQELDLRRFAVASEENLVALGSDAELDDYTYRVAGCVGEFWTRICRVHLFPDAPLDETRLLADGVRFGKGLQLVNILRDLPVDLSQGRCYLPTERLSTVALKPADLLEPANEPRLRPLYGDYLNRASAHLQAGWEYTNTLPRHQARVRIACALPILLGMKTISLLKSGNVLDPQQRIKVDRSAVKRLLVRLFLLHPFPTAWKNLFPAPRP